MTYPTTSSVFLLGATGYVGGSILSHLLDLPEPPKEITTISRSAEKIKAFTQLSTNGTKLSGEQGSYDDEALVVRLASSSDVVVSAADSDDTTMIEAILKGIKQRYDQTKKQGVLVHISGTGELIDDAQGMFKGNDVYTDLGQPSKEHPNLKPIAQLPDTALHRNVDSRIDAADREGYLRSYIILPGTIWGEPSGVAFEHKFSHPNSQQIPSAVRRSMVKGQASQAGKGLNHWAHVHIDEVQSLFAIVYPSALTDKIPHGPPDVSGYYLAVAGEYRVGEAVEFIGSEMHKQGWAETADVVTATEQELKKAHGDSWFYPGTNSRGIAENSSAIGWKPTRGIGAKAHEWEDYVRGETRRVGKEYKDKQ